MLIIHKRKKEKQNKITKKFRRLRNKQAIEKESINEKTTNCYCY